MFSHFGTVLACDRQTDYRQTHNDSIHHASIALVLIVILQTDFNRYCAKFLLLKFSRLNVLLTKHITEC